jgi:PTH1 family peptidyl-tRNA hydrolase
MVIILGLGNPGPRYLLTRHNIGFRVVDTLSEQFRIPLYKAGHHSYYGRGQVGGNDAVLAKPVTYMNRSGLAALALCRAFAVKPSGLLVVYDDLDLPPGKIRLRPRGGSGGHKGLESVIFHLQSEDFPRLRIGIGRPDTEEAADYVLAEFNRLEAGEQEQVLKTAARAAAVFVREGIDTAMNRYNRNPNPKDPS